MLHGLLIFHEKTGALLFQKRFSRGFGLPGAVAEPSIADPIGLALQLYAFNKFSGGLSESSKLEHFSVASTGVCVCFASGSLSIGTSGESPVVLALFSELSQQVGKQAAALFLESFLSEHGSQTSVNPPDKQASLPLHSSTQSVARGGMYNFMTLDECLHAILDLLVGALNDQSRIIPHWLAFFYTPILELPLAAPNCCIAEAPYHIPHPPVKPPPTRPRSRANSNSCSRPPLASRILQKLPGSSLFSPRESTADSSKTPFLSEDVATQNFYPVVQSTRSVSAPPPVRGDQNITRETKDGLAQEIPAQGKISWWFSRRSRSQNATLRVSDKSIGKETKQSIPACYFFSHESEAEANDAAAGVARLCTCVWLSSVAKASSASSVWIETIEMPPGLPRGYGAADGMEIVTFRVMAKDCKLIVAMPTSILQTDSCEKSKDRQIWEDAILVRRALDANLIAISDYIRFLQSLTRRLLPSQPPLKNT